MIKLIKYFLSYSVPVIIKKQKVHSMIVIDAELAWQCGGEDC